jgi:hypothetical protein
MPSGKVYEDLSWAINVVASGASFIITLISFAFLIGTFWYNSWVDNSILINCTVTAYDIRDSGYHDHVLMVSTLCNTTGTNVPYKVDYMNSKNINNLIDYEKKIPIGSIIELRYNSNTPTYLQVDHGRSDIYLYLKIILGNVSICLLLWVIYVVIKICNRKRVALY